MKKILAAFFFLCSLAIFSAGVCADGTLTQADIASLVSEVPEYSGLPSVEINGDIPFLAEVMDTAFDGYGPLDDLGRCTVAFACIGPETMPTDPREIVTNIHPSGWSDIKDDKGENIFNRCHLIGFQLTGQNANECNLITGTRYMNVEGMLPFENSIASYVKETGNHVMYRVTPCFEGNNLIAAGVLLEARSVEDSEVQFCVWCYNVQPGVDIDYAGASVNGAGESEDTGLYYILNTNTEKFHYPECDSVKDIKEKNRSEYYGNRDDLLQKGYEPCGRCRP